MVMDQLHIPIMSGLSRYKDGSLIGTGNIVVYCLKVLFLSPILGIALGLLTVICLRFPDRRVNKTDIVIQIAISISCAYLSFYIGEGVLHLSGVLTCVSAGIVLAVLAPPLILEPETFYDTWELIGWIANTLIFLVAGLMIGNMNFTPTSYDFAVILIVYLLLLLTRSLVTMLLFPLLRSLGYGLTVNEAIFNVWGGLRGAMVIALTFVFTESAREKNLYTTPEEGDKAFFIIGCATGLNLLINGTSTCFVLEKLGLIEIKRSDVMQHYARKRIQDEVKSTVKRINDLRSFHHLQFAIDENVWSSNNLRDTEIKKRRASLNHFFEDSGALSGEEKTVRRQSRLSAYNLHLFNEVDEGGKDNLVNSLPAVDAFPMGLGVQLELQNMRQGLLSTNVPRVSVRYNNDLVDITSMRKSESSEVSNPRTNVSVDASIVSDLHMKNLRKTFLEIIRSYYWRLMEDGYLPRKNIAFTVLLYSIEFAMEHSGSSLRDWDIIENFLSIYSSPLLMDVARVMDYIISSVSFGKIQTHFQDTLEWSISDTQIYVLTSFVRAHENAQDIIPESIIDGSEETPEKRRMLLESHQVIESAEAMLSTLDDNIITYHMTKQATDIILRVQENTIELLQMEGILCELEAEEAIEEVHDHSREMKRSLVSASLSSLKQGHRGNMDNSPARTMEIEISA